MGSVGQQVKQARQAVGLSQRALADLAGVPLSTVGRIERDMVDPRWDTLQRIASALGADLTVTFVSRLPDWLADRREEVAAICRRHGASRVAVFGSVADGTSSKDSDLDLLVDLAPDADLISLVRLERELAEALSVDVDVIPREALTDRMAPTTSIPLIA